MSNDCLEYFNTTGPCCGECICSPSSTYLSPIHSPFGNTAWGILSGMDNPQGYTQVLAVSEDTIPIWEEEFYALIEYASKVLNIEIENIKPNNLIDIIENFFNDNETDTQTQVILNAILERLNSNTGGKGKLWWYFNDKDSGLSWWRWVCFDGMNNVRFDDINVTHVYNRLIDYNKIAYHRLGLSRHNINSLVPCSVYSNIYDENSKDCNVSPYNHLVPDGLPDSLRLNGTFSFSWEYSDIPPSNTGNTDYNWDDGDPITGEGSQSSGNSESEDTVDTPGEIIDQKIGDVYLPPQLTNIIIADTYHFAFTPKYIEFQWELRHNRCVPVDPSNPDGEKIAYDGSYYVAKSSSGGVFGNINNLTNLAYFKCDRRYVDIDIVDYPIRPDKMKWSASEGIWNTDTNTVTLESNCEIKGQLGDDIWISSGRQADINRGIDAERDKAEKVIENAYQYKYKYEVYTHGLLVRKNIPAYAPLPDYPDEVIKRNFQAELDERLNSFVERLVIINEKLIELRIKQAVLQRELDRQKEYTQAELDGAVNELHSSSLEYEQISDKESESAIALKVRIDDLVKNIIPAITEKLNNINSPELDSINEWIEELEDEAFFLQEDKIRQRLNEVNYTLVDLKEQYGVLKVQYDDGTDEWKASEEGKNILNQMNNLSIEIGIYTTEYHELDYALRQFMDEEQVILLEIKELELQIEIAQEELEVLKDEESDECTILKKQREIVRLQNQIEEKQKYLEDAKTPKVLQPYLNQFDTYLWSNVTQVMAYYKLPAYDEIDEETGKLGIGKGRGINGRTNWDFFWARDYEGTRHSLQTSRKSVGGMNCLVHYVDSGTDENNDILYGLEQQLIDYRRQLSNTIPNSQEYNFIEGQINQILSEMGKVKSNPEDLEYKKQRNLEEHLIPLADYRPFGIVGKTVLNYPGGQAPIPPISLLPQRDVISDWRKNNDPQLDGLYEKSTDEETQTTVYTPIEGIDLVYNLVDKTKVIGYTLIHDEVNKWQKKIYRTNDNNFSEQWVDDPNYLDIVDFLLWWDGKSFIQKPYQPDKYLGGLLFKNNAHKYIPSLAQRAPSNFINTNTEKFNIYNAFFTDRKNGIAVIECEDGMLRISYGDRNEPIDNPAPRGQLPFWYGDIVFADNNHKELFIAWKFGSGWICSFDSDRPLSNEIKDFQNIWWHNGFYYIKNNYGVARIVKVKDKWHLNFLPQSNWRKELKYIFDGKERDNQPWKNQIKATIFSGSGNIIAKTETSGSTWTIDSVIEGHPKDVYPVIADGETYIFYSQNNIYLNGEVLIPNAKIKKIQVVDHVIFILTQNGKLYRYTDGSIALEVKTYDDINEGIENTKPILDFWMDSIFEGRIIHEDLYKDGNTIKIQNINGLWQRFPQRIDIAIDDEPYKGTTCSVMLLDSPHSNPTGLVNYKGNIWKYENQKWRYTGKVHPSWFQASWNMEFDIRKELEEANGTWEPLNPGECLDDWWNEEIDGSQDQNELKLPPHNLNYNSIIGDGDFTTKKLVGATTINDIESMVHAIKTASNYTELLKFRDYVIFGGSNLDRVNNILRGVAATERELQFEYIDSIRDMILMECVYDKYFYVKSTRSLWEYNGKNWQEFLKFSNGFPVRNEQEYKDIYCFLFDKRREEELENLRNSIESIGDEDVLQEYIKQLSELLGVELEGNINEIIDYVYALLENATGDVILEANNILDNIFTYLRQGTAEIRQILYLLLFTETLIKEQMIPLFAEQRELMEILGKIEEYKSRISITIDDAWALYFEAYSICDGCIAEPMFAMWNQDFFIQDPRPNETCDTENDCQCAARVFFLNIENIYHKPTRMVDFIPSLDRDFIVHGDKWSTDYGNSWIQWNNCVGSCFDCQNVADDNRSELDPYILIDNSQPELLWDNYWVFKYYVQGESIKNSNVIYSQNNEWWYDNWRISIKEDFKERKIAEINTIDNNIQRGEALKDFYNDILYLSGRFGSLRKEIVWNYKTGSKQDYKDFILTLDFPPNMIKDNTQRKKELQNRINENNILLNSYRNSLNSTNDPNEIAKYQYLIEIVIYEIEGLENYLGSLKDSELYTETMEFDIVIY